MRRMTGMTCSGLVVLGIGVVIVLGGVVLDAVTSRLTGGGADVGTGILVLVGILVALCGLIRAALGVFVGSGSR